MATTASPAAPVLKRGVAPLRAGQGTSFLLRRLHSLTGIIPVGAFLFEHILISNASAISGPDAYTRQVNFLANLPLVFFLELFGIWIPILFHGLYGASFAGTETRCSIPGRATGCTHFSAGRAASLSFTSCGTPTRCASRASICTMRHRSPLPRCKPKFTIPCSSSSTWSVWSRRPGTSPTASGCFRQNGEACPGRTRIKDVCVCAWRFFYC